MATAGYTVAEACAILGISGHSQRKRIRDGLIQAQRVERPPGSVWVVHLEQVPAGVRSGQPVAP